MDEDEEPQSVSMKRNYTDEDLAGYVTDEPSQQTITFNREAVVGALKSAVEDFGETISERRAKQKPDTASPSWRLVKSVKTFLFTTILTLFPLYWFILVLLLGVFASWSLASAVAACLLIYPHIAFWKNEYIRDVVRLRTLKLLNLLIGGLFEYLPLTVYKTSRLNPAKKYLFGYHPHGALSLGVNVALFREVSGWDQLFPNIPVVVGVANSLLLIPLLGSVFRRIGFIPASPTSMSAAVQHGHNVMLLPGGIAEMLEPGSETEEVVFLHTRKGFIRFAIKEGLDLVPVYGFGENQTFYRYTSFKSFRVWLSRKLKIMVQLFTGRFGTLLLPYQQALHVVVGKPIPVKQCSDPSEEEVERLLSLYIDSLIQLFESHKRQLPEFANKKLVVI
jgi:hypothetical protein